MKPLDRALDRVQREVELDGRSHAECVFLQNLEIQIPSKHVPVGNEEQLEIEQLNELKEVVNRLRSDNMWMEATLNCGTHVIQFLENDVYLDMMVTLYQTDVYRTLERDMVSCAQILRDLCLMTNDNAGEITFKIGCAFAKYSDMVYVEENTIDMGD